MKRHGEHVVMIGSSSGIGLAAARLAQHEGTQVTPAAPRRNSSNPRAS